MQSKHVLMTDRRTGLVDAAGTAGVQRFLVKHLNEETAASASAR